MTSRDFCFWIQGFFELTYSPTLNDKQLEMVKRHLALVFKHEIDPSMGNEHHQAGLNQTHSGGSDGKMAGVAQIGGVDEHGNKYRC